MPDLFQRDAYGHYAAYPQSPGFQATATSAQAADKSAKSDEAVRALCLQCLREFGPQTADEVCARLGMKETQVRPRMTQLKRLKLIRPTGEKRQNRAYNRCDVMEITR